LKQTAALEHVRSASEASLGVASRERAEATTKRGDLAHEQRILLTALAGGLPAVIVVLALLWGGDFTPKTQWTLGLLVVGCWLGFAFSVRERVVFPLRTLSNLLAALREGDYSLRARLRHEDALAEVMREVNMMGQMLREQRFGAIEATTLLRTVMEEIDVAVFSFDAERRLKLVNRAGERLLAKPAERLLGRTAAELDLEDCLGSDSERALDKQFPGGSGRWSVRLGSFREQGEPHQLLALSDLTRELREEELKAWQRLVRVIGHELNNSLAPIKSIAGSLEATVRRDVKASEEDLLEGLAVIGSRAEALSRFMSAYARLAKLPEPTLAPVRVGDWVRRVAGLESRCDVAIISGDDVEIRADGDQLEQLLINLVRNAVDAMRETGGRACIGWRASQYEVEVWVEDDGPGLASNANLFVPFFTTKPGGSGIGLVLCRKIAENHGGAITIENRAEGSGCVATLKLPKSRSRSPSPARLL